MSNGIIHDVRKGRFLIETRFGKAKLKYKIENQGIMNIRKTKVPLQLRGIGIGSGLVDAAMQYASLKGLIVVPTCSFVRKILSCPTKVRLK